MTLWSTGHSGVDLLGVSVKPHIKLIPTLDGIRELLSTCRALDNLM